MEELYPYKSRSLEITGFHEWREKGKRRGKKERKKVEEGKEGRATDEKVSVSGDSPVFEGLRGRGCGWGGNFNAINPA